MKLRSLKRKLRLLGMEKVLDHLVLLEKKRERKGPMDHLNPRKKKSQTKAKVKERERKTRRVVRRTKKIRMINLTNLRERVAERTRKTTARTLLMITHLTNLLLPRRRVVSEALAVSTFLKTRKLTKTSAATRVKEKALEVSVA